MERGGEFSTVETPEAVELVLPLAGLGSRAFAAGIDLAIQIVPVIAAFVLALGAVSINWSHLISNDDNGNPDVTQLYLVIAILQAVIFVVQFGYGAFFETIWRGQTPGKRAMGLRVVLEGGRPIDGRAALVRNLLRAADILPAWYAVGAVSIFVGRDGKRLGDHAAGTLVIADQRGRKDGGAARAAADAAASVAAGAWGAAPEADDGVLTADERKLVTGLFDRTTTLPPGVAETLALDIARSIAQRLGDPVPYEGLQYLADVARRGRSA